MDGLEWQIDNDRPVYSQLVEQVERAIAAGGYRPGQKLPGVRELAAQAGVNPNTMQRALQSLEQKGLVYAQRTSGRFVTKDTARIAALREEAATALTKRWVQDMRALGCQKTEIERYLREAQEEQDGKDTDV